MPVLSQRRFPFGEIDWLVALRTVGHDGTVWFLLEQLRKRRTGSTQQRGQARTGPARSARENNDRTHF